MSRFTILIVILLVGQMMVASVQAQLTPAGTLIISQATATYNVGLSQFTVSSNITQTPVAELLDVSVVWQDVAPIIVNPGDTDQAVAFLITNTGNGFDSYLFTGLSTLGGDDFDPTLSDLYYDSNNNGVFDYGVDAQYIAGTNDTVLAADSSVVLFVLNSMPTTLLDGEYGNTQLTVTSNTGWGDPGLVIDGQGEGGTDAVVGYTGSNDDAIGVYVVSNITITIVKTSSVLDQLGGTEPVPGAMIIYSLVVDLAGTGIARNVVITDVIPVNTTYVAGSITLNTNPITDPVDGDTGNFGATPNTVTVTLGDLPALSPFQTVTFSVTIN